MSRRAVLALVSVMLAGCGGGGGPRDGGADAGGDGGLVTPPAPPDIAWLDEGLPPIAPPGLSPCPAGWREVRSETGAVTCEPYPEGGAAACPEGEAHFPGEPGCAPVGSPCPPGDFAEGLPADGTVRYVLAGASGGDGSRASPFGRIADALSTAAAGTTIAVGKGSYDEVVSLRPGVTVRGACAAETRLAATGADPRTAVVNVSVGGAAIVDLTIADSPRIGVLVQGAGAELGLDGVVVTGMEALGVEARDGARLVADSVAVRATRSRPDGLRGSGLRVHEGASAEVSRALFEGNHEATLSVAGEGTRLTIGDAVVRDTGSLPDGRFGRGLEVVSGASAEVSRALFEGNRDAALLALGAGTSLSLTGVVVRDTESRPDGLRGRGLELYEGASAEVIRALFDRNRDIALYAEGVGTSLMLADAVVRDTRSRPDMLFGRGLDLQEGASAEVSRTIFEGNREVVLVASDVGTTLTLVDTVVGDTASRPDGLFGRGLQVNPGAEVTVSRVLFERNRDVAALAAGEGTSLTLSDVVVRDTASTPEGLGGTALAVQAGASARVSRVLLERNRFISVFAGGAGARLTLADAVVRDTEGRPDDLFGRGLEVSTGASAEVSRTLFERNREIGVLAAGEGTSLTLVDTVVRDTASRPDGMFGHNVTSVESAELAMTRFVVSRASLCGLLLSFEGQIDLATGEVSESRFGICLQVPGYARSRLTRDVVFRDVGGLHPIEETTFPAPEPVEPTGIMP
jgi:hypothetical protein